MAPIMPSATPQPIFITSTLGSPLEIRTRAYPSPVKPDSGAASISIWRRTRFTARAARIAKAVILAATAAAIALGYRFAVFLITLYTR